MDNMKCKHAVQQAIEFVELVQLVHTINTKRASVSLDMMQCVRLVLFVEMDNLKLKIVQWITIECAVIVVFVNKVNSKLQDVEQHVILNVQIVLNVLWEYNTRLWSVERIMIENVNIVLLVQHCNTEQMCVKQPTTHNVSIVRFVEVMSLRFKHAVRKVIECVLHVPIVELTVMLWLLAIESKTLNVWIVQLVLLEFNMKHKHVPQHTTENVNIVEPVDQLNTKHKLVKEDKTENVLIVHNVELGSMPR